MTHEEQEQQKVEKAKDEYGEEQWEEWQSTQMAYICEFCDLKFKTLTEKTLHVSHAHPEKIIKDSTQTYRYFESLNRKYGRVPHVPQNLARFSRHLTRDDLIPILIFLFLLGLCSALAILLILLGV